jgi:hypothetical protein
MNDMLTDTMSDDAVIARLRSALDEVATTGGPITAETPDGFDASVLPLRTASAGRRPARTWIGVAAATVVLMGGAGWALSQRTSPTATGADTTLDSTPSVTDPTATPLPDTGDAPWYTVGLADAVPGGISTATSDDPSGGFTQSWVINGPNGDTTSLGLLIIDVSYTDVGLPPDQSIYTETDAPQGTAWLLTDPGSPTSGSPSLVWQRTDGTAWSVTQAGLIGPADADGSAFADYVFQVQRGTFNDLLSNPDERAEWVGASPTNQRTDYTQSYAVGGVDTAIVLRVGNTSPLNALATATGIADTSVAGNRAWRGTQADGETTVVWVVDGSTIPATSATPQQWWGILRISPVLGDRVDEVLASVTMATPPSGPSTPDSAVTIDTSVPLIDQASGKPADAPSYVLDDPAFSVEGTDGVLDLGAGTMPRGAVWTVDQTDLGAPLGFVFATAFDWGGMPYQADGVTYLDVSRNGVEAVLYVGDPTTDPPSDPQVYFPQADGVVWVFEGANLVSTGADPYAALVDLAFALGNEAFQSGSGSEPAALDGVTQFGNGSLPSREYDDTYAAAAGGIITVTVHEGFAPGALRDATDITSTTVLDRPALVGTLADGSTQVVWQAADDSPWWVSLTLSAASAASDPALVDQAIAALRPA